MASRSAVLCLLATFALVQAALPDGRPHANFKPLPAMPKVEAIQTGPVTDRNGNTLPPYNTTYYFDQLIDHTNPSLGTFTQRYWHTWEFYEPGGCIVISTPGEGNAEGYDGYLTNRTLNGMVAQQENCATVVIEHRFYGLSNPYPDLSVKSLRVHTIQQAIDDLDYFAKNVALPMPGGDKVKPDSTPWVLSGGSYSGALTSFTLDNKSTFWAGYASSAVVESIVDFWGYFEPIRQNMPKNCSADVQSVINHIDTTFTFGSNSSKQAIKAAFGLEGVEHLDDVSGALRNNLWDWQSLQPYSGNATAFRQFCDALEVKDGKNAPASGWGLDHALQAWGAYWKNGYLADLCGTGNVNDCLGTYDPTQEFWSDITIDNAYRSWTWIVCNEVGFFQEGAPLYWPSLVSRLIQPPYDIRQCSYFFPEAYAQGFFAPQVGQTNKAYDGWSVRRDRLFFANGRSDPWREATVSADGVSYPNTTAHPVGLSNGFHCSDLLLRAAQADATVAAVQTQALASMKSWLAAFPKKLGRREVPGRLVKPVSAWVKGAGQAY